MRWRNWLLAWSFLTQFLLQASSFDEVDASFNPPYFGPVDDLLLTPDQKIWAGGNLLAPDGATLTNSLLHPNMFLHPINSLAFDADLDLLIGRRMYLSDGEPDECPAGTFECFDADPALLRLGAPGMIPTPFRGEPGWAVSEVFQVLPRGDGLHWLIGTSRRYSSTAEASSLLLYDSKSASLQSADASAVPIRRAATDASDGVIATINGPEKIGRWEPSGRRVWEFTTNVLKVLTPSEYLSTIASVPGSHSNFVVAAETQSSFPLISTRLLMFSPTGELLPDFSPPEIEGNVKTIAFETHEPRSQKLGNFDRIFLGGDFARIGDVRASNIAALDRTGQLVWTPAPDAAPNGPVEHIRVQLDGAILVAGRFTTFAANTNRLVRLSGMKNEGQEYIYWEQPETRIYDTNTVVALSLRRAGSALLPLTVAIAQSSNEVISHRPHEVTFPVGETQAAVRMEFSLDLERLSDDSATIDLTLTNLPDFLLATRKATRLIVLNSNKPGMRDPHFTPPPFQVLDQARHQPSVPLLAVQPDGKILVAYNDYHNAYLMRLYPDGSSDPTFQSATLSGSYRPLIQQISPLPDGSTYISGSFSARTGNDLIRGLVRLSPDGSVDPSFSFFSYVPPGVRFWRQPNGRLIVSTDRAPVFRLHANGTPDASFKLELPAGDSIRSIYVLNDGALLVSSIHPAQTNLSGIRRYFADGALDRSFPVMLPNFRPIFLAEPFLYGQTTEADPPYPLQRLDLTTLALDGTFHVKVDGDILTGATTFDGGLVIAGQFTHVETDDRCRLARLKPDGSLDRSFNPGSGPNDTVSSIVAHFNGTVYAAGLFTHFDHMPVGHLVRLWGPKDVWADTKLKVSCEGGHWWVFYGTGRLQFSEDLRTWRDVNTTETGRYQIPQIPLAPLSGHSFYRAIYSALSK